MDEAGKEGSPQMHEARIPSSSIDNFQDFRKRLAEARSIKDIEQRKKMFEDLLKSSAVVGSEGTLHDEMWSQFAKYEQENPTEAEKRFGRESSFAVSQVANRVSDLSKPKFEGLIIRSDGNGDVTDILVKQVLPGDDADRVTQSFGLKNLANSPAKKFEAHVPDAPANALKTRIS